MNIPPRTNASSGGPSRRGSGGSTAAPGIAAARATCASASAICLSRAMMRSSTPVIRCSSPFLSAPSGVSPISEARLARVFWSSSSCLPSSRRCARNAWNTAEGLESGVPPIVTCPGARTGASGAAGACCCIGIDPPVQLQSVRSILRTRPNYAAGVSTATSPTSTDTYDDPRRRRKRLVASHSLDCDPDFLARAHADAQLAKILESAELAMRGSVNLPEYRGERGEPEPSQLGTYCVKKEIVLLEGRFTGRMDSDASFSRQHQFSERHVRAHGCEKVDRVTVEARAVIGGG